jgi:membrane-bound metal-dependent hydrolase YbcI (DUF457 family)
LECPHCKLMNPTAAGRCDCGYDFASGRLLADPKATVSVHRWRSPSFFIFPAAYVAFALAVQAKVVQWEGSWGWFFVFIAGFPASLLGMFASYAVGPFIGFSVFGGIQWYFVNRGIIEGIRVGRGSSGRQ